MKPVNEISQSVSEKQTRSTTRVESVGEISGSAHIRVLDSIIEKLNDRFYDCQLAAEQSGLVMKALGGIVILGFFLGIYFGEHL